MMYHNKLVAVVKCNGKVLREDGDLVTLPFGSDYSILLKNLSSQKASIEISIDGNDVLNYQSLLLDPNSEIELMGALRGTDVRNRFRFIQKTKAVQDHRGDKIDDGMIRIEYAFEKKVIKKTIIHDHHHHNHHTYYTPPVYRRKVTHWEEYDGITLTSSGNIGLGDNNPGDFLTASCADIHGEESAFSCHSMGISERGASNPCEKMSKSADDLIPAAAPMLDEGITVAGSRIDQNFNYGSIGKLEPSEVIILRLKGYNASGSRVKTPVTIKTKLKCDICGITSNSRSKFCSACGTSLEV
jgi:hypothetical protein